MTLTVYSFLWIIIIFYYTLSVYFLCGPFIRMWDVRYRNWQNDHLFHILVFQEVIPMTIDKSYLTIFPMICVTGSGWSLWVNLVCGSGYYLFLICRLTRSSQISVKIGLLLIDWMNLFRCPTRDCYSEICQELFSWKPWFKKKLMTDALHLFYKAACSFSHKLAYMVMRIVKLPKEQRTFHKVLLWPLFL